MKKLSIFLSVLYMSLSCSSSMAQSEGLIAHWSFDAVSNGQFADSSSFQRPGNVFGASLIPGIRGQALEFDGFDDYARVKGTTSANPLALYSSLDKGSISIWFRIDSIPTTEGMMPIFYFGAKDSCPNMFDANSRGLVIEVGHSPVHRGSRRLYFTIFGNNCFLPSFCYDSWDPIIEGQWYHFVAIVGETYNTGYLNGVEMTERKYNFGFPTTTQFFSTSIKKERLWLGRGFWDAKRVYLDGAIDELRIYDKDLSAAEVAVLFQQGSIPATTNIEESTLTSSLQLFPNPSSGNLTIKMDRLDGREQLLKIRDILGRIVKTQRLVSEETLINVKDLPAGRYLVQIFENESLIVRENVTLIR